MKTTKKSALMSAMALFLCLTMLLGTTWAWFTDSVTSSGNKIQAGNLKLDLEMLNKETGAYESIKTSKDPIFNYNLWEPGYTDVKLLKVENEGSLSLKWKAMFVSDAEVSKLAEVIDVWVKPSVDELAYSADRESISAENGWRNVGTLDNFINTLSETTYGNLLPYSCAYLGIALHMQESAGNDYQKIGLEAFDIQIVATQMSQEEDSFGKDYDNDAEWPNGEMKFKVPFSFDDVATIYGELAEDKIVVDPESGAYAIIPAGAKIVEGVEPYFSGNGIGNSGTFSDEIRSYDIHIEGIASDNTKPITVFIGKILPAGLGETELKLYHEDVQMTRVNSVEDFAINNQFTYDAETGAVVLYVTNFSVFSGVKTTADVWDGTTVADGFASGTGTEEDPYIIETAAQLVYFRKQVDAGVTYKDQFVKLNADIDLSNKPFDPIGFGYWYEKNVVEGKDQNTVFMGTFDGGNHTIYNLYQNCWELDSDKTSYSTYTYSTAGAGLFASIKNATIKNLAISGAEIVFECVDMGIVVGYAQGTCHFENIVVTKSKIANYNRYTGGVVGEVSYGPYGIDTNLGYSHTFKNVVVDSTVTVSGLWGSFGCGMGGVIGGKWGDATVKMENVVSAPTMDVYNDVVSAYQWYAFRGCGMLIGHTEEPYSDGRHSGNATASFLKCENVKVYYGGWVDQNYYRFSTQTDKDDNPLWYSNYPWVRAEAGEYCDAFSNIRYGIPQIGGVKVTEIAGTTAEKLADEHVVITFDQLYGADRGMYGTAAHEGVTINNKDSKTIYVHNNAGWTNLKLQYWFANGNDTWTTLIDGIDMSKMLVDEANGIYKIQLPETAYAFKIVADGVKSDEFVLVDYADGATITLGEAACEHEYDNACDTTCNKCEETREVEDHVYTEAVTKTPTCTEVGLKTFTCSCGDTYTEEISATGHNYSSVVTAPTCTADGYTTHTCTACGDSYTDNKTSALGHKYDNACDKTCNTCGATRTVGDHQWYNANYTCKICNEKAPTKTIYFQNNWLWSDVKLYYWYSLDGKEINNSWPGTAMVWVANDGTKDYYSLEIPLYVEYIQVNGIKNDNSGNRDKTGNILLSSIEDGSLLCMDDSKTNRVIVLNYAEHVAAHKVFYLDLTHSKGKEWKNDGARFAAYVWKTGSAGVWFNMSDTDGDGIYSCWIPTSGNYNNILFGRMNPDREGNNFTHSDNGGSMWNQTTDQTPGSYNCFQITKPWNGNATGNWSKK